MFYTYLWLREDGTPYYVGKGKGKRAFREGCPKIDVIPGWIDEPDMNRIILQEHPTEQETFRVEEFFISLYGRLDLGTGILRNLTGGGENPPKAAFKGKVHTKESKEKMSKIKAGKHISPATEFKVGQRPSISTEFKCGIRSSPKTEFKSGNPSWNKGVEDVHKGEKNPFFGRKHSEESKERMRQAKLKK